MTPNLIPCDPLLGDCPSSSRRLLGRLFGLPTLVGRERAGSALGREVQIAGHRGHFCPAEQLEFSSHWTCGMW